MATTTETALQVKELAPSFTVDDLQKSISFFEGLRFGVDERWEDEGVLLGVMVRAGGIRIGLNQDDWEKGRDRQKGVGTRLFLGTTQNIDEVALGRHELRPPAQHRRPSAARVTFASAPPREGSVIDSSCQQSS
jgi:hypothetical protein